MKATKYKHTGLFLSLVIFFVFTANMQAQQNSNVQKRLNQLKAKKIAFLSQQMQLTPEEAQVFWPVYNEFVAKKESLNKNKKQLAQKLKNDTRNLSDKQKEVVSDQLINNRLLHANLEIEYHKKFKAVLPISKVIKLYQSENQFKSELIRQLKEQQIKRNSSGQMRRKD